jgi:hypothetical protein
LLPSPLPNELTYLNLLGGTFRLVNIRENEDLDERCDVAEAVVGALSGITAIGVVFATGVVVVPILGAVALLAPF